MTCTTTDIEMLRGRHEAIYAMAQRYAAEGNAAEAKRWNEVAKETYRRWWAAVGEAERARIEATYPEG